MRRAARALFAVLAACGAPGLRQDFAPVAAPAPPAVGERWATRVADGFNNRSLHTLRHTVTAVSGEGIEVRVAADPGGEHPARGYDARWNPRTGEYPPGLPGTADGPGIASGARVEYAPALPLLPFPLAPRQVWQERVQARDPATGRQVAVVVQGQVLGMGTVTVPAGSFEAVKVQTNLYYQDPSTWRSGVTERRTDWYAPALGRVVYTRRDSEYTDQQRSGELIRGDSRVEELLEAPQRGA
ncbi:MAG TPA: hypothetical protein VF104_08885 [Burkholderiales bacterium]